MYYFPLSVKELSGSVLQGFSGKKKVRQFQILSYLNNRTYLMDLAGIEPASESLSLTVSPITVDALTFPRQHAQRQAYCVSSFIIHLPGQSLPGKVSHIVDARSLKCECRRADEQQLRLLTRTVRLRLYLSSRLMSQFRSLRMAALTSKPPSKPVQALNTSIPYHTVLVYRQKHSIYYI